MARTKDVLKLAVERVLRPEGFRRGGGGWYLEKNETTLIVWLEKLDCSRQWYIELGVYIRSLSSEPNPKIEHCHIRIRLNRLVDAADPMREKLRERRIKNMPSSLKSIQTNLNHPIDMSLIDADTIQWLGKHRSHFQKALDLDDTTLADEERAAVIEQAVWTIGLPFLQSYDTIPKICRALRKGGHENVFVWKSVYELCKIPRS